jgi:tagatose-1,6-bisphosphate aldolase non-catalytic subunit AgaZ/GatZ
LVDPQALFNLARVLAYGAKKYGENNWRSLTVQEHLNHALQHIYAYLAGDFQDDHLGHAQCRVHMALAVLLQGGPIVQSERTP